VTCSALEAIDSWRAAPSATLPIAVAISAMARPVSCEVAVICWAAAATEAVSSVTSSIIAPSWARIAL
jgi:hypothetical protein